MAIRPVFQPDRTRIGVIVSEVNFQWHPGLALSQRRRSVDDLHRQAAAQGLGPILEASTASTDPHGQRLSAFHLLVPHPRTGDVPLECAFQAGKVFRDGGPYQDLLRADPRDARRDPRLRDSGPLTHFYFAGLEAPSQPVTLYYDWLYLRALQRTPQPTLAHAANFAGYTDISFNPARSLSCQARSLALFASLRLAGVDAPWELTPPDLAALITTAPVRPGQQALFG